MRRFMLVIILFSMLTLTGCIQKYELTEVQSDSTAEYMAGLLLKCDEDYKPSLVPLNQTEEDNGISNEQDTVTLVPTQAAVPTIGAINDESGTNGIDKDILDKQYTLTQVIGKKDFTLKYIDFKLYGSYPEDSLSSYFSLTPAEGNQLLVASFSVNNESNSKKTLNLNKEIQYELEINGDTQYTPLFTLLENDLQYIKMTIDKGVTKKVVLIFEIDKKIKIEKLNLTVTQKDKSALINLK